MPADTPATTRNNNNKIVIEQIVGSGSRDYKDRLFIGRLGKSDSFTKKYFYNNNIVPLVLNEDTLSLSSKDELEALAFNGDPSGITKQTGVITILLPTKYYRKIVKLEKSFIKSYSANKDALYVDKSAVLDKFKTLSEIFANLPFERAVVELTKSQSIKFTLLFKEEKLLLISKSIEDNDDLADNNIVFSFFINKELIMSDVSEAQNFMEGFKKFLTV